MKMFHYMSNILVIFSLLFSFAFFSPTEILAQGKTGSQNHVNVRLDNPLGSTHDVPTLISKLLDIVIKVGVPLVALAIIWTGYLFIAARGKAEEIAKAKQALLYTLIGALILLGAYAIASAVVSTIDAIRS